MRLSTVVVQVQCASQEINPLASDAPILQLDRTVFALEKNYLTPYSLAW
jgi:hypothetical protein